MAQRVMQCVGGGRGQIPPFIVIAGLAIDKLMFEMSVAHLWL